MINEEIFPNVEPDLEARIVAMLQGEASDLERDQLETLLRQHPELLAAKHQFSKVHDLLENVGSGEPSEPGGDWRLSSERRETLLNVLDGKVDMSAPKAAVQTVNQNSVSWRFSRSPGSLVVLSAACVVLLAGLSSLFLLPSQQRMAATADRLRSRVPQSTVEDTASQAGTEFESQAALSKSQTTLGDRVGTSLPRPYYLYDDSNAGVSFSQNETAVVQAPSVAGAGSLGLSGQGGYGGGGGMGGGLGAVALQSETRGQFDGKLLLDLSSAAEKQSELQKQIALPEPAVRGLPQQSLLQGKEAAGSAETQAVVPDGGTVLLGGIRREVEKRLEDSVESKSAVLYPNETISERLSERKRDREAAEQSKPAGSVQLGDTVEEDVAAIPAGGPERIAGDLSGSKLSRDIVGKSTKVEFSKEKLSPSDSFSQNEALLPSSNVETANVKQFGFELAPNVRREMVADKQSAAGLGELSADDDAFSTFSLHVSDVSFKLASAALAKGQWPEANKIRIEEFVNAFDYRDPLPSPDEKVACRIEQGVHPFLQQRNLMRVSLRTAAAGRASSTPLRLTLLLDNSGSMVRPDRRQTVRRAFEMLTQQLQPTDQITLISFARTPRLLADRVSVAKTSQLLSLIDSLPSEGGTNLEQALLLAFEKAQEQWLGNAQNRIVLLTDGAVNLGDANPESLSQLVMTMRDSGIAFDAAGISAQDLNDNVLESLTRKGDGRYYLLDTFEQAGDGFAQQLAGAFRPSAKNVKVQVEFNPNRVGRYKLLGFEEHRLNREDFRNDEIDAAEMAAAEAGVAVYQFEAKPDGVGDVGSVSVRFKDISSGQMVERRWPILYEPDVDRVAQAAPSMRIATAASMLAAKLLGPGLGESVDLKYLSALMSGLPQDYQQNPRVQQLQAMIGAARNIAAGP